MSVVTSKKPKISAMSSPIGMMTGIVGNLRHGKTQRNRVKRDFDDMSKFLNRGANNIRRFNLPKGQKLKRLTDINIKGGGGGILGSIMNAVTGGAGLLGLGSNLLGIADFANDIRGLFRRGGKVGRDGRTALQRAKDLKKLKQTGKAVDATQDAVRGARQGTKVLDSVADASKGLRGVSKANAALNIASAGLEFGFRKAEGQTNTQAVVGTAADAAGGMAGFALASKATATALSPLLVTPVPGARILYGIAVLGSGIMGSMAGSKLAASGADKLTGADKVGEDLEKFNKEQEQKKEEQEAKKQELDSPTRRKTFSELLDKFEDIIEKFRTSVKAKKIVRSTTSGSDDGRTGSVSVQEFTGAANVVGADHPETGSGYGIAGQVDQNGRPLVFSQPAASAFAGALKESGMNLGSYVASSGRSQEKNTAIGGHENSHHMYGEALDMNGEGYEWMRENGHKFGWQYVYNHGPGSAHFKYVGPGAGTTPKLAPPGNKPSDPEPAPTAAPPTSGNDGARTESQLKRDETKTRAGVDRNTVIDEETGFTAGEMEDMQVKNERIKAMKEALGRDKDWGAGALDWLSGQATVEGYSKMLRDQGKGEEVDRIMNEIQGGYVEEVAAPVTPKPEVTPQITPSPAPQQVMSQVSTQISSYQSYEQGGDNLVIMPVGGQSQQPQMMSGPGGQQIMMIPMGGGASVNRIQKDLLTTKLAGC